MSQKQNSLDDALSMDIHILSILLQRNRHQHHRCIYFRRLSMVLQALRKTRSSIEALGTWNRHVEILSKSLNEITTNGTQRKAALKRPQKEEHWTLEQLEQSSSSVEVRDSGKLDEAFQQRTVVNKIQSLVNESIPQISSRILHAARAVFQELGRGHFLPFLTVAIACLGRIHAILLQMGRESVASLKENNIKWDGNTDYLFEVTNDELVKKINAFVDDLRWKDAVRRFKLGKGLSRIVDVSNVQRIAPGDQCASNSHSQSVFADVTSCANDDPGVIVAATSKNKDESERKSVVQDDNLAVCSLKEHIPGDNMSKYEPANDDLHSTLEKQVRKKKKKRKDKKKRNCDIDFIFSDNDFSGDKQDSGSKQEGDLTRQKVTKAKKKKTGIIDDIFS